LLQRQCTRKASALTVTAKFELKPPPYPMVRFETKQFLFQEIKLLDSE
jgi:hypothetical protein